MAREIAASELGHRHDHPGAASGGPYGGTKTVGAASRPAQWEIAAQVLAKDCVRDMAVNAVLGTAAGHPASVPRDAGAVQHDSHLRRANRVPGGRDSGHALARHRPAGQENPRPPADARREALHAQGPRVADRTARYVAGAHPRSLEVEDRRRGTTLHADIPNPRRTARPWEPCPVHPPSHSSQGTYQGVEILRVAQDNPVPSARVTRSRHNG